MTLVFFYSHSDVNHLTAVANKELQNINTWMNANKLFVNVKKTNYVIFKSKQRRIGTNISPSLDGFVINQQKFVNSLGVLIDENVSWKCHVNHIRKKMSKSIGIIISRASFYLSTRTKISLHCSLVYPYLTYCNIAWSST